MTRSTLANLITGLLAFIANLCGVPVAYTPGVDGEDDEA